MSEGKIQWTELAADDRQGNGGKRLVRLTFAQPIHQVDSQAIDVEVADGQCEMFTEQYVKEVHELMGKIRGNELLDDAANDLLRKQILEGVR